MSPCAASRPAGTVAGITTGITIIIITTDAAQRLDACDGASRRYISILAEVEQFECYSIRSRLVVEEQDQVLRTSDDRIGSASPLIVV